MYRLEIVGRCLGRKPGLGTCSCWQAASTWSGAPCALGPHHMRQTHGCMPDRYRGRNGCAARAAVARLDLCTAILGRLAAPGVDGAGARLDGPCEGALRTLGVSHNAGLDAGNSRCWHILCSRACQGSQHGRKPLRCKQLKRMLMHALPARDVQEPRFTAHPPHGHTCGERCLGSPWEMRAASFGGPS